MTIIIVYLIDAEDIALLSHDEIEYRYLAAREANGIRREFYEQRAEKLRHPPKENTESNVAINSKLNDSLEFRVNDAARNNENDSQELINKHFPSVISHSTNSPVIINGGDEIVSDKLLPEPLVLAEPILPNATESNIIANSLTSSNATSATSMTAARLLSTFTALNEETVHDPSGQTEFSPKVTKKFRSTRRRFGGSVPSIPVQTKNADSPIVTRLRSRLVSN